MDRSVYFSLLFVALCPVVIFCQTCETWNGTPEGCKDFIDYPVYVPANETQDSRSSYATLALNVLASTNNPCHDTAQRFVCAFAFNNCTEIRNETTNATIAVLPHKVCRGLCEDLNDQCKDVLSTLPASYPPNCDDTDPDDGQALYPETSLNYTVAGETVTMDCFDLSNRTSTSGPTECPYPLAPSSEGACTQYRCPIFIYSDEEWKASIITNGFLAWLGIFTAVVVFITYSVHKKRRKFPSNMIMFLAVGGCIGCVAFVLPTFVDPRNKIWCEDEYTFSTFDNGLCVFQSCCLLWGSLATASWWVATLHNLWHALFFGYHSATNPKFKYIYHGICWTVPTILLIIGLAAKKFKYPGGGFVCSFEVEYGKFGWDWGLAWFPLTIMEAMAVFFIAGIVYKLFHTFYGVRETSAKSFGSHKIRILACLTYELFVITYILCIRYSDEKTFTKFRDAFEDYAKCVLEKGSDDDCELSYKPSFGQQFMVNVVATALSIVLFTFLIVLNTEIRTWWINNFKTLFNRLRGRATADTANVSTRSKGESSSGGRELSRIDSSAASSRADLVSTRIDGVESVRVEPASSEANL